MSTPTRDDAPAAATGVPRWDVGDRIRKARREAGMRQQELAAAIGVPVNRLSNWEAGDNKPNDVIGVRRHGLKKRHATKLARAIAPPIA